MPLLTWMQEFHPEGSTKAKVPKSLRRYYHVISLSLSLSLDLYVYLTDTDRPSPSITRNGDSGIRKGNLSPVRVL